MIYLDHNATTALRPGVLAAMQPWFEQHYGNANSQHRAGRLARQAVEQARAQVAALVHCEAAEVFFTSGSTESINWALRGLCPDAPRLVGSTDHEAVLETLPHCERLAVDQAGRPDLRSLKAWLQEHPRALVSVMAANNETGVLANLAEISAVVKSADGLLHTDATQMCGRLPVDFRHAELAAMSVSAHKLGGPKGVGALILRRGQEILAIQRGGKHEQGLRAGTLNVPGIVGFAAACEHAQAHMAEEALRHAQWRDAFEQELCKRHPQAEIFGLEAKRLPNTSFFALPGWHSEALLMALDKAGFALASGSACTSGTDVPSHVLTAMGVPAQRALGAVRMSLGHNSLESDLPALLDALDAIVKPVSQGGAAFAGLLNQ
nr:cysteine desulfurase [Oceanococcus sp. HetDA_MAG_MS8]